MRHGSGDVAVGAFVAEEDLIMFRAGMWRFWVSHCGHLNQQAKNTVETRFIAFYIFCINYDNSCAINLLSVIVSFRGNTVGNSLCRYTKRGHNLRFWFSYLCLYLAAKLKNIEAFSHSQ